MQRTSEGGVKTVLFVGSRKKYLYLRGLTNLEAFFRKQRSETSARSQCKNDSNICLVAKHQHSVQKRSMLDDLCRMQNDLFVV